MPVLCTLKPIPSTDLPQGADELRPGQGRIGDSEPIRVLALGAEIEEIAGWP